MPLTNNSVESWHGKFTAFFVSPHPALYTLIENIECANSISIIKAFDDEPGHIKLCNEDFINMHHKLINNEISLENYLIWGRNGSNDF